MLLSFSVFGEIMCRASCLAIVSEQCASTMSNGGVRFCLLCGSCCKHSSHLSPPSLSFFFLIMRAKSETARAWIESHSPIASPGFAFSLAFPLFSLLFLRSVFTLGGGGGGGGGTRRLSSPMFPFLVLGPFNHEEMFFSSPRAPGWEQLIAQHKLKTLTLHLCFFSSSFPLLPISKAAITGAKAARAFKKRLGSLINVLWLSPCYWLIPLVLPLSCGP